MANPGMISTFHILLQSIRIDSGVGSNPRVSSDVVEKRREKRRKEKKGKDRKDRKGKKVSIHNQISEWNH